MAHIVVVPERVRNRPLVHLEIARGLVARGHDITYVGHADATADVEAIGARFVEIEGTALHHWVPPAGSKIERLLRFPPEIRRRRQRLDEQVELMGLGWSVDLIAALAPDLVVSDIENLTQTTAARAAGVATVAVTLWPQPFKRQGNPPPDTDIVPGVGFAGSRVGIELAWLRSRARKLGRTIGTWIRDGGADLGSIYRHMVRVNGMSVGREHDRWQWMLPMSYAVPTLALSSACFDMPGPDHPRLRRSIAVVPDPDPSKLSPELADLIARNRESGRALVYVGFGSYVSWDGGFFERALAAFARHPEWDVVVGLGGSDTPGDDVPSHVHLVDFAPQVELLEHADVAVLHGGGNSLHEALRFGVPIVSYPFRHVHDQPGNGARVVKHGVGVVGERTESVDEIEARIVQVLADPAMARAAGRMQAAMIREEHDNPVGELIESFLEEKPT